MSDLSFIHITDCHLGLQKKTAILDNNEKQDTHYDTTQSLVKVVNDILLQDIKFDFVLVTGDISQSGNEENYSTFHNLICKLQKPVYCLPGNHDSPELLKTYFTQSPNQAISVNIIKQHLLILLNTHVSGCQAGEVSTSQLQQLENMLSSNNNRPVIIAMHHHPKDIDCAWLDKIKLKNGDALLNLIEKFSDVKLACFGHVHQAVDLTHKHIQLKGSPSSSYQFTPKSQTFAKDSLAPGYRLVNFNNNRVETHVYRLNE